MTTDHLLVSGLPAGYAPVTSSDVPPLPLEETRMSSHTAPRSMRVAMCCMRRRLA